MSKKTSAAVSQHDSDVKENTQPLITHLMAFRKLVISILVAVLVGFVVAFYFLCDPLMHFITSPIESRGIQIIYTAVSEAFTTQLKLSLLAGVVVMSPFIFYQIWAFVKPALYENEIRLFRFLFFVALILFLTGIVFFLVSFLLPFGVVFELPVAIFIAARLGVVNYKQLTSSRKFVFFGLFILAAILTPPDVISQIMLGMPMYVLFEVGVLVARFTKPRQARIDTADGE